MTSQTPTILTIDGNSLAHRAFHAVREDERVGAWMCDTFVRIVAGVWWHGPFDAIIVGFDHHVNHRKLADDGYKAGRSEKDPVLVAQLALLPGQLEQLGWEIVCVEGMEADDVLASAAVRATQQGWRTFILSSDRDLTAQVNDNVTLLRPRATMGDLIVTDPARVRADYNVEPQQYVDYAAMRGDASDGLKGVNGIGPKAAARLLRDHGTVEEVLANLHNLLPATEAKLRSGRAELDRNLLLMTPITSIDVDVELVLKRGLDVEAMEQTLLGMDLGRAAGQLRRAIENPEPPMPPPPEHAPDEVMVDHHREIAPALDGEQDALF